MEIEFIKETHQYLVNGILVPSVSEILQFIFPNKYSGIPKNILENAALWGTHIHEAIEDYENGKQPNLTDLERVTFEQYLKLKKKYKIKAIELETIVSYEYEYCGRLDGVYWIDGVESLCDVKTTSKLDVESLSWQLGFYQLAKGKIYDKCYCIYLPKKDLGRLVEITPKSKKEILAVLAKYKESKIYYVCNQCGNEFKTPQIIKTNQELLFGLPSVNEPTIETKVCPVCQSEKIERKQ